MQLQAKGNSPCVVPNSTPTTDSGAVGPLVKVGSCQITLGGSIYSNGNAVGNSLPCSQVAEYAKNLSAVCRNSQMSTAGRFYPNGSDYGRQLYVGVSGSS